ncbi:MAG: DUF3592 domain-containing protein, partial [Gammaproteobacteria bacterium]|nr:DUF3592 domain-containing protein [Gammaproteobacteria bacterium]
MNKKTRFTGFTVVALWLGLVGTGGWFILSVGEALLAWQQVQHWQPVTVQLESLQRQQMTQGNASSLTTQIMARYHYTFNGKRYTAERVGSYEGMPLVDGWHEAIYDRLKAIPYNRRAAARELTAWVNPQHPQESLLDRSLRWVVPLLLSPAALFLFATAWLLVFERRQRARGEVNGVAAQIERLPGDPELATERAWRTGVMYSDSYGSLWVAWLI